MSSSRQSGALRRDEADSSSTGCSDRCRGNLEIFREQLGHRGLIRDALVAVANGTRTGRSMHAVRPGYLKLAIGSHFICFRIADDAVDVVRVLHQRMDIAAHLQDG